MPKRPVPKNYNALEDLMGRIRQFIQVNELALERGELTDDERLTLEAQNRAFQAVVQLIDMIRKKGSIWKGGYLDNVGVVYSDQIQDILDEAAASDLAAELDNQLKQHLED